jgi:hypothetical protein
MKQKGSVGTTLKSLDSERLMATPGRVIDRPSESMERRHVGPGECIPRHGLGKPSCQRWTRSWDSTGRDGNINRTTNLCCWENNGPRLDRRGSCTDRSAAVEVDHHVRMSARSPSSRDTTHERSILLIGSITGTLGGFPATPVPEPAPGATQPIEGDWMLRQCCCTTT